MTEKFGQDYFVGGERSNYSDYRAKRFDGLADDLIKSLPLRPMDSIIDFGCATGALMHALKRKGIHNVKGTDVSMWAVNYGRDTFGFSYDQLQYFNLNLLCEPKEWIIALDVLEHCPPGELERILQTMKDHPPKKGLAVRIPVSAKEGEDFVLDVSKNDRTHVQIHEAQYWRLVLGDYGFAETKKLNEKNIYDSKGVYCAVFSHAKNPMIAKPGRPE